MANTNKVPDVSRGEIRNRPNDPNCQPQLQPPAASLRANLRSIATLADAICGESVSHNDAPFLKNWMNQIQELARKIQGLANHRH